MNLRKLLLCLSLGLCSPIAFADNTAEVDRLKQVAEEIQARRALRSMGSADRTSLVFVKESNGLRLATKDRLLVECYEGLSSLFGKEVLMTQLVASKKITLQTEVVSSTEASLLMTRKLIDTGILVVELGDDSLLLVTKSQLPKSLRLPAN